MSTISLGLGIAGSAASLILAGAISSVSLLTVPVILEQSASDSQLLQLWRAGFDRGKLQAPVLAGLAALCHINSMFLRQSDTPSSSRSQLAPGVIAVVLTIAIVPFTLIIMGSTNSALMLAADTGAGKEAAKVLIKKWSTMNLMRSFLPLVGGVVGLLGLSTNF